jgi:hypothetical protein
MNSVIANTLGIEYDEPNGSDGSFPVIEREAPKGVSADELTKISEEALHDGFVDLKQISDHSTAMALELFASIDGAEPKSKPRVLEVASQLLKTSVDAIKQSQDAALKHIEKANNKSGGGSEPTPTNNNQFNFFGDRNELMKLLAENGLKNITGDR